MAESFWITANYAENQDEPLAVRSPKHLRYESIGTVTDYLISEGAKQEMKESEKKIVGHIRKYIEKHRKEAIGERVDLGLVISLKNREGVWEVKGNEEDMPDLSEKVTSYIRTEPKKVADEDIDVDVLNLLFEQVTRVGTGYNQ